MKLIKRIIFIKMMQIFILSNFYDNLFHKAQRTLCMSNKNAAPEVKCQVVKNEPFKLCLAIYISLKLILLCIENKY